MSKLGLIRPIEWLCGVCVVVLLVLPLFILIIAGGIVDSSLATVPSSERVTLRKDYTVKFKVSIGTVNVSMPPQTAIALMHLLGLQCGSTDKDFDGLYDALSDALDPKGNLDCPFEVETTGNGWELRYARD